MMEMYKQGRRATEAAALNNFSVCYNQDVRQYGKLLWKNWLYKYIRIKSHYSCQAHKHYAAAIATDTTGSWRDSSGTGSSSAASSGTAVGDMGQDPRCPHGPHSTVAMLVAPSKHTGMASGRPLGAHSWKPHASLRALRLAAEAAPRAPACPGPLAPPPPSPPVEDSRPRLGLGRLVNPHRLLKQVALVWSQGYVQSSFWIILLK